MIVSAFQLKQDFRAPNATLTKDKQIKWKSYKANDTIKGSFKDKDPLVSPFIALVITTDGYTVPAKYVTKLKDLYNDADGTPLDTEAESKKVVDNIEKIANQTYVKELTKKTNYSMNGALIGAVGGIVYALAKGKGVMFPLIIGALAGGLIGKYFSNHATGIEAEGKTVIDDAKKQVTSNFTDSELKNKRAKRKAEIEAKAKEAEQVLQN